MLAAFSASLSFAPPSLVPTGSKVVARSNMMMSEEPMMGRRELLQSAAALPLLTPLAAFADGANSPATAARARGIYGSRVVRLQKATTAEILEEANAIQLFISGAYRGPQDKAAKAELMSLQKKILASAKAGDEASAKAALKDFIKVGALTEQDNIKGGNWDPKQRRNAGAPPTAEIEAQMATYSYSLYEPLKAGAPKPTNGA